MALRGVDEGEPAAGADGEDKQEPVTVGNVVFRLLEYRVEAGMLEEEEQGHFS